MSEYIPLEVQEEILKRLPVKPLIQFRSVSKQWRSFIDSPDFIASYGVRQTHPNRLILRYKHIINPLHGEERYLAFVDNDHSFIKQDITPAVPGLIKDIETNSIVVGSSHGLLCVNSYYKFGDGYPYDGTEIVVLWNPSINKSIGIEVPYMHDLSVFVSDVTGFGVCPVTFDPTIVKIGYGFHSPWKVEIFTLSTGTWRILSTNLPRESIRDLENWSQVVIDRFIYWAAVNLFVAEDDPSRFWIISFDLTAKEFKEINLTGTLTNQLFSIQGISKLRGSLVVLSYHGEFEEDPSVCCLWMMKEQGISKSFTKLYTINLPDATVKTLLGFRKTGDLILETQHQNEENAQLEVYNPYSKAIDNLGVDGKYYSVFMCYMVSLLLHDQLDGFIYTISN
uniref:F-box/kelch-repeat protein At3g06240-like n=1 Tax=Erigeron canadensis TaxID=72917 RepID=UPI001CB9563A|nr:F-box/kelch-repeat protein At3g06240-like [Erigeron canadensis]